MTIATILAELAAKHGNDWPDAAITQLILLADTDAIFAGDDPDRANYRDIYLTRYLLLRAWIHDTLCAGIACRQTSAL